MERLGKPGKHTISSFHDREAIARLEVILNYHKLVTPDLKKNDTWPNTDGYLEVNNKDGYPKGKLEAQVKTLNENSCKQKIIYRFDTDKFLSYSSDFRELAILFIGVDREKKCAYWQEITPNTAKKIIDKNGVISLSKKNIISEENLGYYSSWLGICEERQEIIKIGYQNQKNKKILEIVNENIENKFHRVFISQSLKRKYYLGFIHLLPYFYIDIRGEKTREVLRKLFELTKKDEREMLIQLKKEDLIEITGSLVSIKDQVRAKECLNELLDKIGINLIGNIIDLLLK